MDHHVHGFPAMIAAREGELADRERSLADLRGLEPSFRRRAEASQRLVAGKAAAADAEREAAAAAAALAELQAAHGAQQARGAELG